MWLTNNQDLWAKTKRTGGIRHNLSGKTETTMENEQPYFQALTNLLKVCKSKHSSELDKMQVISTVRQMFLQRNNETISENDEYEHLLKRQELEAQIKTNLNNLLNFFSEFSFSPNFRFVNTFTKTAAFGHNSAKAYVQNYFALTDNAYYNQICEKMQSLEFKEIADFFSQITTDKTINNRFKLYYGSQGTGKTTQAMKEANNNAIVCHSAMLPSDLMEDFAFEDGKANFKPSQLYKAMTEGQIIVLDEINLLPFESLRFLQSILDGKSSFVYKGQTVEIKDGFQIIGTMNLQVNGMVYALPEPLVDRASELKEFKLTAEHLMGAIL